MLTEPITTPVTRPPCRIVIADDHEMFRQGFTVALRKYLQVQIIGYAGDGQELMERVIQLLPDVVFADIEMPRMDGIAATREIKRCFPFIHVIALSAFMDDWMITDMIEAGAEGYLLKNTTGEEIVEAIEKVTNGKLYYTPDVANRLVELNKRTNYNPLKSFEKPGFTQKEIAVMQENCKGLTNKEIAAKLGIEPRQVELIKDNIRQKTGCVNSAAMATYAVQNFIYRP